MHRSLLVLATLALAACGVFGDADRAETSQPRAPTTAGTPSTTTTQAPPSTPPAAPSSTGTAPATAPSTTPVQVGLAQCGDAGDFDLLCEAYDILTTEYVDTLADATLAEAAARGIEEFAEEDGAGAVSEFTCQVPAAAFTITCDAAASALAAAGVDTVVEAAIQGMLEFGLDDPNTVYLTPDALARIKEEDSGQISGIGALVSTDETLEDGTTSQCVVLSETCRMSIVGLIEGAPAEREGMQVGDVTVTVNGESVMGWTADEVVATVRGPEGTPVELGIERDGELLEFTIIRAPIVVPVAESEVLGGGVGYVALSQFTANSAQLFRNELQALLEAGVDQVIVDLRNNPGGALTAAVRIASEFLADGLVVRTESPDDGRSYGVEAGGIATSRGIDVVVLVNGASASASEVVSSALQEAGRATIVGEPTFGKDTVQQRFDLSNGGAVKVTIARWVTPNGSSFGGDGVQPDVLVEADPHAETDLALDAALALFTG